MPGPVVLRRHQAGALAAAEAAWAAGRDRVLVVLPPGAGKTLLGVEAARRRLAAEDRSRAVVLGPNTAIQGQWAAEATARGLSAGTERSLSAELTALTYQAVAVFDAETEVDDDGVEGASLVDALHANGRALVERLRAAGPILLVLDECHHLVEVWGRLLEEILAGLPQAQVLALTATPPDALTREQAELTERLFGPAVYAASIPAVVREGDLAPFAELVWLTEPTAGERDWLAESATRFRELTTRLVDPAFGDPAFLPWLDRRFVERPGGIGWSALLKEQRPLCDAALRMHHAGLLALPPGARPGEEHRREPDAEDWMVLVEAWLEEQRETSGTVEQAVRRALPAVGFVRTRRGIRRGRSPVDRVLARSESKTTATVAIAAAERADLGDAARLLVLCDHERAAATLPADLEGVLAAQAGSALAVLDALVGSAAGADAVLVTGRTVAGTPETLATLVGAVAAHDPDLAASLEVVPRPGTSYAAVEGPWSSRTWVPYVTAFFEAGGTHVLVGTRGLLGEGWDARRVTGLVDLTAITTTTAVVQTRGRALRTDPAWPDKVALNWSVVCVAEGHPRGDNDWRRLVRKHTGFFGVDRAGEVVDGVGHVDPAFSPFAPPAAASFDQVNARMQVAAQARAAIRERWRVGTAYQDRAAATLRIRPSRPGTLGLGAAAPVVVQTADRVQVRLPGQDARTRRNRIGSAVAAVALVALYVAQPVPAAVLPVVLLVAVLLGGVPALVRGRARLAEAAEPPSVDRIARAVADGLHAAGLAPVGADAVHVVVDEDGAYRCRLAGVEEPVSRTFATALDEAVSAPVAPRYVVPRWVVLPGQVRSVGSRLRVGLGLRHRPGGEVWHAVPSVLGTNAERARAYAAAWDHWVGGGPPLYTGSPEGAGVLAAQAGADPLAVSTTLRRTWS